MNSHGCNHRFGFFLLGLALLAFPQTGRADLYTQPWGNQFSSHRGFQLSPFARYLATAVNFDATGSAQRIVTLQQYEKLEMGTEFKAGLSRNLSLYGELQWSSVNINQPLSASYSSGLSDQTFGSAYRLLDTGPWTGLDLQAQITLPTYTRNSNAQYPYADLGQGLFKFAAGPYFQIPFTSTQNGQAWLACGGFAVMAAGAQGDTLLPWRAEVRYLSEPRGLQFALGAYGAVPLSGANSSDLGVRSLNSAGGSFIVDSTVPTFLAARHETGYRFDSDKAIRLVLAQTARGKEAPSVRVVSLQFEWNLGSKSSTSGSTKAGSEYEKSNQGLVAYYSEAKVVAVSSNGRKFKFKPGLSVSLRPGSVVDVFSVRSNGALEAAIARAIVLQVRQEESVAEVIENFIPHYRIKNNDIVKVPILR